MRRSLGFLVLPLVVPFAGCGGGQETAPRPTSAQSSSSASPSATAPGPDDSPFIPRGNDPICGVHSKWTGSRCVVAEDDDKAGLTENRAAAMAREGKRPSGGGDTLGIEDITVGTGREVRTGDIVKVHYTGTLEDGSVFDSSRSKGTPFEFHVGQGEVIKGFDRGILGMKVGGRRKVRIPYVLGYGVEGSPPRIPPRANLTFDLELMDVM